LWLGTPKGIVWAPKAELLAVAGGNARMPPAAWPGRAKAFSRAWSAAAPRRAWQTPDGALWFATLYGLVKVDPETLPFNSAVPPVRIERILVNDQPAAHVDAIELPAAPAVWRSSTPR